MCSTGESDLDLLQRAVSGLVTADVSLQPDERVRDELGALLVAVNQLQAAVLVRSAVFDARGLSEADGCRDARAWLTAFGRLSPTVAAGTVKRGRLLRDLPALAHAAGQGAVTGEQLTAVSRLVDQVGVDVVKQADTVLADLAATAGPAEVGKACDRIRAYVDPDGGVPDAMVAFDRRHLTLSRQGSMVAIRGQLDPQAGAAVITALDALTRPPTGDDLRTPGQRRADALADLATGALDRGWLPSIGGQKPHLAVLITPTALLAGHRPDQHPTPAPDAVASAQMAQSAVAARMDLTA